jgi:hypothetical protein
MSRQALRCKAKRSNGEPCRAFAIRGGEVCSTHGGRAPQTKRKAAERVALEQWAKRYGGGPAARDVDPATAVLTELSWASTHVEWFRSKLQEDGAEWADRYDRERSALVKIAETAHRMGIEERQIALAEAMGAELILLINRVAQHPDIPMTVRPALRRVFAAELRALPGGSDA